VIALHKDGGQENGVAFVSALGWYGVWIVTLFGQRCGAFQDLGLVQLIRHYTCISSRCGQRFPVKIPDMLRREIGPFLTRASIPYPAPHARKGIHG
jgi:hypothetical protein